MSIFVLDVPGGAGRPLLFGIFSRQRWMCQATTNSSRIVRYFDSQPVAAGLQFVKNDASCLAKRLHYVFLPGFLDHVVAVQKKPRMLPVSGGWSLSKSVDLMYVANLKQGARSHHTANGSRPVALA